MLTQTQALGKRVLRGKTAQGTLDEPLDRRIVDAWGEVAVGGYGLDFEPLVGQEL